MDWSCRRRRILQEKSKLARRVSRPRYCGLAQVLATGADAANEQISVNETRAMRTKGIFKAKSDGPGELKRPCWAGFRTAATLAPLAILFSNCLTGMVYHEIDNSRIIHYLDPGKIRSVRLSDSELKIVLDGVSLTQYRGTDKRAFRMELCVDLKKARQDTIGRDFHAVIPDAAKHPCVGKKRFTGALSHFTNRALMFLPALGLAIDVGPLHGVPGIRRPPLLPRKRVSAAYGRKIGRSSDTLATEIMLVFKDKEAVLLSGRYEFNKSIAEDHVCCNYFEYKVTRIFIFYLKGWLEIKKFI